MKKGNHVELHLKKMLCIGAVLNEQTHIATVWEYDEKKECIFLLLETGKLTDLSLDAIYDCKIQTEEGGFSCTGRITERYCGAAGKIFKFEIENGFYKINLK